VSYHVQKVLFDNNPADGTVEPAEQNIIDATLATPFRVDSHGVGNQGSSTIDIYFVKQFDAVRR
jgi:hypothetical protein